VNALGLADLDRKLRPVGYAYRELIEDWTEVLPTQSVCLQVPIALTKDYPWLDELPPPPARDTTTATSAPRNTE
jgi:hypothetical protein